MFAREVCRDAPARGHPWRMCFAMWVPRRRSSGDRAAACRTHQLPAAVSNRGADADRGDGAVALAAPQQRRVSLPHVDAASVGTLTAPETAGHGAR